MSESSVAKILRLSASEDEIVQPVPLLVALAASSSDDHDDDKEDEEDHGDDEKAEGEKDDDSEVMHGDSVIGHVKKTASGGFQGVHHKSGKKTFKGLSKDSAKRAVVALHKSMKK